MQIYNEVMNEDITNIFAEWFIITNNVFFVYISVFNLYENTFKNVGLLKYIN